MVGNDSDESHGTTSPWLNPPISKNIRSHQTWIEFHQFLEHEINV